MSLSTCFFNNHYVGTCSSSSELHASRSVTIEKTSSTTGSPIFAIVSSSPSTGFSTDLQLYVDLTSYPL